MSILYKISRQPVLQQKVYETKKEAEQCPTGDIALIQSPVTGIVSNVLFDSSKVVYDESYACNQSVVESFKKHIDNVEVLLRSYIECKKIIEVGCGKGFFVEFLRSRNYDAIGFDKTYDGQESYIYKSFFEKESGVRGDILILRHVLEHIQDPVSFLDSLSEINGRQGLIYIEVPCLEWILENRTFFDITYEHVNYFTIANFISMFADVRDIGHCFNGQYIYVIADLASLRSTPFEDIKPIFFPVDFLSNISNHIDKFISSDTSKAAIWGAAGKGVQYAVAIQYMLEEKGLKGGVTLAIDNNPAKQNHYLAVSGARVISPDEALQIMKPGSNIVIMNPNYEMEIREQTQNKYQYNFV